MVVRLVVMGERQSNRLRCCGSFTWKFHLNSKDFHADFTASIHQMHPVVSQSINCGRSQYPKKIMSRQASIRPKSKQETLFPCRNLCTSFFRHRQASQKIAVIASQQMAGALAKQPLAMQHIRWNHVRSYGWLFQIKVL